MAYLYVALTIAFTVYGQLVFKWRLDRAGPLPEAMAAKLQFLAERLLDPWILSGFASAFLASLAWMAALTQFPIGRVYPFTSLSFVAIALAGWLFFAEPLNAAKLLGLALVVLGLAIGSQRW